MHVVQSKRMTARREICISMSIRRPGSDGIRRLAEAEAYNSQGDLGSGSEARQRRNSFATTVISEYVESCPLTHLPASDLATTSFYR